MSESSRKDKQYETNKALRTNIAATLMGSAIAFYRRQRYRQRAFDRMGKISTEQTRRDSQISQNFHPSSAQG
jgi:hypothetical protein